MWPISNVPLKEYPDADWPPDREHPEIPPTNSRNRLPPDPEANPSTTGAHNSAPQIVPQSAVNASPLSENMTVTAQPQFVPRLPDPIAPYVLPHSAPHHHAITQFVPPPHHQFHLLHHHQHHQQPSPTYSPQSQIEHIHSQLQLQHNSYMENIQRLRWQLDQQQWLISQVQAALEVSTKQSAQLLSYSTSEVSASEGDARAQKALNEQQHDSVLKLQTEALNNLYKYTQVQQQIQQQIQQQLQQQLQRPLDPQKVTPATPAQNAVPQPPPMQQHAVGIQSPASLVQQPPAHLVVQPGAPAPPAPAAHQGPSATHQGPPPAQQAPPAQHQVPPPARQAPPVAQQVPPAQHQVPPAQHQVPPPAQQAPPAVPPVSQHPPDHHISSNEHSPRSQSLPTNHMKRARVEGDARRSSAQSDAYPIEESTAENQEQPGKIPILGQKVSRYQAMLRRRRSMAKSWRIIKPEESPEKPTVAGYSLNTNQPPADRSVVSLSPTDQAPPSLPAGSLSTSSSASVQPEAGHSEAKSSSTSSTSLSASTSSTSPSVSASNTASSAGASGATSNNDSSAPSNPSPANTSPTSTLSARSMERPSVLSPIMATIDESDPGVSFHKKKWKRISASPLEPRVSKASSRYLLSDPAHKPPLPLTPITPPVRNQTGKPDFDVSEKKPGSVRERTDSENSEFSSGKRSSYETITGTNDESDSSAST